MTTSLCSRVYGEIIEEVDPKQNIKIVRENTAEISK